MKTLLNKIIQKITPLLITGSALIFSFSPNQPAYGQTTSTETEEVRQTLEKAIGQEIPSKVKDSSGKEIDNLNVEIKYLNPNKKGQPSYFVEFKEASTEADFWNVEGIIREGKTFYNKNEIRGRLKEFYDILIDEKTPTTELQKIIYGLVKREFETYRRTSEKEFISKNMDIKNPGSYINEIIAYFENHQENFKEFKEGKIEFEEFEKRAILKIFSKKGLEYIDLLIQYELLGEVGPKLDIQYPRNGLGINPSQDKLFKKIDTEMLKIGLKEKEYYNLTREQIRSIVSKN